MPLAVRPIGPDEYAEFVRVDNTAFGTLPSEEDAADPDRLGWPLDRSVAAFDGGRIVGSAGAYPFEMTLPGLTSASTAGVTWVGVLPTHRRRGVLTAMMRYQLDDIHERGEPLAILLASESVIYGRFGYGLATVQAEYELARHHRGLARPHEPLGRVVLVDGDEANKALPEIHERVRRNQPGDVSRPDGWWASWLRGPSRTRNAGPRFYALYEGANGEIEGYAYYRVGTGGAPPGFGEWSVMVQGLGATTLDGYVALWQYVTDIDLTVRTTTTSRPLDEPIRYLLADPRRLKATAVNDFLWCRLVDVPRALAARRYPVEARLVIEVHDEFCPWNEGRWQLEGGPNGAECSRTTAPADLVVGVNDLGAVYLGGTRLAMLGRVGRVDEATNGSVARADLFFSSTVAPYCQTFF